MYIINYPKKTHKNRFQTDSEQSRSLSFTIVGWDLASDGFLSGLIRSTMQVVIALIDHNERNQKKKSRFMIFTHYIS